MFLADQHKAIKSQNPDVKLLDLAANAIKEWDQVLTIRDEYLAKSLEESEKYDSQILSSIQPSVLVQPQPQVTLEYDANGKVKIE